MQKCLQPAQKKICSKIKKSFVQHYKLRLSIQTNIPEIYVNNSVLTSTEGTTQADPFAIIMYGIGIIPMFELLQKPNVIQKWLADNGKAAGDLKKPGANFENLDLHGKAFGDKVKPSNFNSK